MVRMVERFLSFTCGYCNSGRHGMCVGHACACCGSNTGPLRLASGRSRVVARRDGRERGDRGYVMADQLLIANMLRAQIAAGTQQ